jgi:hypothetical protein
MCLQATAVHHLRRRLIRQIQDLVVRVVVIFLI